MVFIFLVIALLYTGLILSFVIGFSLVKNVIDDYNVAGTQFSILVPFRNEENELPTLIKSLEELEYPKHLFEVLLINDASTDDSVEISLRLLTSTQIDFRIIDVERNSPSPKKDAITTAMVMAKNPWIITTDADCEVPKMWLHSIHSCIDANDVKMIVAPVQYRWSNSFLNQFQLLDFLSLQGATIGGFGIKLPFLCNGANFIYKKDFFKALDGFAGNDTIASGDDIFLLEKAIKQSPKSVRYLKSKNAIVSTKAQLSISKLIQQRVRWAAKSSAYTSFFGKLVGFIVLLMNSAILAAFFLSFIGIINLLYALGLFVLKLSIDYLLISKSAAFFNQIRALRFYIFSAVMYPVFSTFIAIYAMFNSYKWKGRHFKK